MKIWPIKITKFKIQLIVKKAIFIKRIIILNKTKIQKIN